jgi:hypothetical protein
MHGHMNVKGVGEGWFRNFRLANIHAVFLFPTQLAPFRLITNSPSTWTKFRSSETYELTYRPTPYKNTEHIFWIALPQRT